MKTLRAQDAKNCDQLLRPKTCLVSPTLLKKKFDVTALKDMGPNKKAKKIIKVRKVSKNQPCCLCPNDFAYEELLPTDHGHMAHRKCAMYTPETWIATEDGKEKIMGVELISKERRELKC